MSASKIKTLTWVSTPSLPATYLKMFLSSFLKPKLLKLDTVQPPINALVKTWSKLDLTKLTSFCGITNPELNTAFTAGGAHKNIAMPSVVPPGFYQCVTFPLLMGVMGSSDFKLQALGGVHYRNEFVINKIVDVASSSSSDTNKDDDDEVFTSTRTSFRSTASLLADHDVDKESGDQTFTLESQVFGTNKPQSSIPDDDNGQLVMTHRILIRFLHPKRKENIKKANKVKPAPVESSVNFKPVGPLICFPLDVGKRFAGITSDINPIHISPFFAKPFGYKSCIVHGMLTLDYAVAAYENKSSGRPGKPANRVYDTEFLRPLFLPQNDVQIFFDEVSRKDEGITAFEVRSKEGKTFVKGLIE